MVELRRNLRRPCSDVSTCCRGERPCCSHSRRRKPIRVITNLGVLDCAGTHYVLRELAPDVTVEQVLAATDAVVDTTHCP